MIKLGFCKVFLFFSFVLFCHCCSNCFGFLRSHFQAVAGLAADGRQIVSRAKSEAASYEK